MKAIRQELVDALGGEAELSPQRRLIIDSVARRVIRIDMLWQEVVAGEASAEDERRLNWYQNGLGRDLRELGLDRKADAPPRLRDVLGGKAA